MSHFTHWLIKSSFYPSFQLSFIDQLRYFNEFMIDQMDSFLVWLMNQTLKSYYLIDLIHCEMVIFHQICMNLIMLLILHAYPSFLTQLNTSYLLFGNFQKECLINLITYILLIIHTNSNLKVKNKNLYVHFEILQIQLVINYHYFIQINLNYF